MRTRPKPFSSASGFGHLLIVYVVWGSTYLAIRLAVREGSGFPPFTLGALRVFVAGGALLVWARCRRQRISLTRGEWMTLMAAGLLMWPGANGLVNWAEQRADSSYAALLLGSLPIWTALIEALLDRKRPTWRLGVSLCIGFAGVGLLSAPRLVQAGGIDLLSIVALLVAPISWAVGSILQSRRPVQVSPMVSAGYLHLFGGAGFVALALATREPLPSPTASAWGAWAYLVVAGSMVAFTSYVRVLKAFPMSIAMTYAYVNPVIAVLLGWLVLNEPVTLPIAGGMILILAGVWGVFREKYRRVPELRLRAGHR